MKTLELNVENTEVIELNAAEMKQVDGGVIPLVAIGIGWCIMVGCSAVALGMQRAMNTK